MKGLKDLVDEFLHAWEKKHGPLTAGELSQAERELGIRAPKKSRQ